MKYGIKSCEVVQASYDNTKFDIKVFYTDGTWQFHSLGGFSTKAAALKTVSKLMPRKR